MQKYLYTSLITISVCLLGVSYYFFFIDHSIIDGSTNEKFSFQITALQNVDTGKVSLVLNGIDDEMHSCSNLEYESTINNNGNLIDINIGGIKEGGICLTSLGPASVTKELGVEVTTGKAYTLKIGFGGVVDVYTISILSDEIKIDSLESRFSKIESERIFFINKNLLHIRCFYNDTWYRNPFDDNCKILFIHLSKKFPEYIKPQQDDASIVQKSGIYIVSNPEGLDDYMDMLFQQFSSTGYYLIGSFQNKSYTNHFCECASEEYTSMSFISKEECSLEQQGKCEYKNVSKNGTDWAITSSKPFNTTSLELEYEKLPLSIDECKSKTIISTCIVEYAIRSKDKSICENLQQNPDKDIFVTEEQCKRYVSGEF